MNYKIPIFLLLLLTIIQSNEIEHCQSWKVDSLNISRCTICLEPYKSNLNYTQCNPCTDLHSACLKCSQNAAQLTCQICDYGYLVYNSSCIPIFTCEDNNCLVCFSSSSCNYCKQGYFLNLTTNTCYSCPYPDQFDTFNQQCACDFGHYLQQYPNGQSKCKKCAYPCQECLKDSNNCTKCIYGFYMLQGGQCELCLISNCIICASSLQCLNCTLGYILAEGTCQIQLQMQNIENYIRLPQIYYFCQIGCFYCYKYDFCLTCLEGYSRDLYNDSCIACPIGCQRCQALYSMQCFNCYSGFRLFNHACLKCYDQNCISCQQNQLKCIHCMQGFTQINGRCLNCASNCIKCDQEGPGMCDINSCNRGFARVNKQTCAACALGCYSCSPVDISTCIDCPLGSFQVAGGQCQICPQGCVICTNISNCSTCRQHYRLKNNLCYPICTYPCLDCSPFNPSICSSCYLGYSLSQNLTCLPDLLCSDQKNCTICPIGYYLNLSTSTCQSCNLQLNCIKCQTQSNKCVICQSGYYVLQNKCLPCPTNCSICQLFDKCFECNSGYFLSKSNPNSVYGSCLPCSADCKTCIDEKTKCNSCSSDKKLIGFNCVTSQNIIFQITLQHRSISEDNAQELAFIKEIVGFTKYLADCFGPPYSQNPQLLFVKDISSGSVKVTYMASISTMDPRLILNTISKSLAQLTSYNDFNVIGTEIIANGFQQDKTPEQSPSYLYVSLVPAPFFLICIAISILELYRQSKQLKSEQEQQDREKKEIKLEPLESQKNLKGEANGAITL